MKVELNTDLIECIVPDTYGTNFCYEIKDDEWDAFKQTIVDIGVHWIREALNETEFAGTEITDVSELKSPREYNFTTDWFNFSLELDDGITEKIKAKVDKDDEFWKWAKERYHSYDGFISFMPYEYDEYMKALDNPTDYKGRQIADFQRAIAMYINYQIQQEIDLKEWDRNYLDDVMEYANQNGMWIDDEGEEEEII